MTVEKNSDDGRWTGKDINGKEWQFMLAMLRNENVCRITVIE